MTIAPLNLNGVPFQGRTNTTPDSALSAAEGAKFRETLEDLQRRAKANTHVVNSESASKEDADLKKACKGFEAMFLSLMYKQMRKTVPESSLFGESNAMKIYRDMQDDEMMKRVADGGGIGLGDMLYKQLSPQVLAKAKTDGQDASK